MIKSIFKDQEKDIPYGKISHDAVSIIPCNNICNEIICTNATVNLAVFTDGSLKIIKRDIGRIVRFNNNIIRIHFNTEFGYDDELYAILSVGDKFKPCMTLILAYKEIY